MMFDLNCFALGWCCALALVAFVDKRILIFTSCLFGAVYNAAILWR